MSALADRIRSIVAPSGAKQRDVAQCTFSGVAQGSSSGVAQGFSPAIEADIGAVLGGAWWTTGSGRCFVVERRWDPSALHGRERIGALSDRLNSAAGEEVRWLPRRRASDLCLPGNDFWLFDDRLIRFHHFSGDGEIVEDELCDDPAVIARCMTAFEAVWDRAVPHADYRLG